VNEFDRGQHRQVGCGEVADVDDSFRFADANKFFESRGTCFDFSLIRLAYATDFNVFFGVVGDTCDDVGDRVCGL